MVDTENIISRFYSDFVLRDLLSFVTPGAILIGSFLYLIWPLGFLLRVFNELNPLLFIPLFGLCYIIGFGLMMCGEILDCYKNRDDQQDRTFNFLKKLSGKSSNDQFSKIRERYIVFMQASGNCCVALILSSIVILVKLIFIYNIFTNYTLLFPLSRWYFSHLNYALATTVILLICMMLLFVVLNWGYHTHKDKLKTWEDLVKSQY